MDVRFQHFCPPIYLYRVPCAAAISCCRKHGSNSSSTTTVTMNMKVLGIPALKAPFTPTFNCVGTLKNCTVLPPCAVLFSNDPGNCKPIAVDESKTIIVQCRYDCCLGCLRSPKQPHNCSSIYQCLVPYLSPPQPSLIGVRID